MMRAVSSTLTVCGVAAIAALVVASCKKKDDEPSPGEVGAECDPDNAESCQPELVCASREAGGNFCAFAPGAVCQPGNSDLVNGGCPETAECVAPEASPTTGAAGAGSTAGSQPLCLVLEGEECNPDDDFCSNDLTCAELESGGHRCFAPVLLRGVVSDTTTAAGIEGAHVIALDDQGIAATDVSESGLEGAYQLEVPVVRTDDGTPVDTTFTLQGSAQDYQPFPSGVRVALPIEVSERVETEEGWVIESALTDIGLIPLEPGERRIISGTLAPAEGTALPSEIAGVLVVASNGTDAYSAISDRSGDYTIFNVPDGEYTIRAYAAGVSYDDATASVAGEGVTDVALLRSDRETTTVAGTIQIVNAFGGAMTSVILVVEDTFDEDVARGEVPRGLRAPLSGPPSITGEWTIEGVPDGNYVVLAAYENDQLVRDPDTNIAGTDFVHITVSSADGPTMTIAESFKVTEALTVIGPGAESPEAVSEPPLLVWADDSSEDSYDVRVFDAFGNEVWSSLEMPGQSGGAEVSLQYAGPLDPGMYYQFRVTSFREPAGQPRAPISMTEDLRGVFYLPGE